MSEKIKMITNEEINENGVCSAPTVLTGTPEENKKIFDKLCREIVIPRLNSLIEEAERIKDVSNGASGLSNENKERIEQIILDLGDMASIDWGGENLSEKIMFLKEGLFNTTIEIMSIIGTWDNLSFFSKSVVGALNYLYEMISPGAISNVPSLPLASNQHLMKIFKLFDSKDRKFKFYICRAEYPEETGFNEGDLCGGIYFEPHISHEMFASFKSANMESFSSSQKGEQFMNIIEFTDSTGNKASLQVRYSTQFDGYLIAFYKDEKYTGIWASKNFYIDNTEYTEGFANGNYFDMGQGMIIEKISTNLSWLLGAEEFAASYSWEEFGKGGIEDITVEKAGRYSTVTFKNGENIQSFTIEDGVDGYTPVKGQDYFTASDIEEISTEVEENIKNDVLSTVSKSPDFVNDISECTDTSKIYVLPDGFLYAYKKVHVVNSPNMFDIENGSKINYRLNSSGIEVAQNGLVITDYIDVVPSSPYEMKISGVTLTAPLEYSIHVTCFDENKNRLGAVLRYAQDLVCNNGVYYEDLYEFAFKSYLETKFVRVTLGINDGESPVQESDVSDLKVEFVPKNKDEIVYQWTNTAHAFVPADYGDIIAELSERTDEIGEELYILDKTLKSIEENTSVYPSVWEGAVKSVVAKIDQKKRLWGRDASSFAFFSDNHTRLGNAGELISYVMNSCSIPYAFFGGDSISNGEIEKKSDMESQEQKFRSMMKPIKDGRFCRALGNHDGYYLTPTGEKYHLPWEEKYTIFMSPDSVYQNKIYGGDGTYYYVDDICTKTRFIVLNSVWFNFKTNDDGTVNNSDAVGYGQTQLSWLCNVLANTQEDYSVVFISHSPVTNNYHSNQRDASLVQGIVNAFISGGEYSGEYLSDNDAANNVSVNVSFGKKGKVIGWFSGHIHRDLILTEDSKSGNALLFKTVTITSDANMTYDETEAERNMDGDTSHAIDFVVANRATGEVCIFRLGIGNDRTYNYLEVE